MKIPIIVEQQLRKVDDFKFLFCITITLYNAVQHNVHVVCVLLFDDIFSISLDGWSRGNHYGDYDQRKESNIVVESRHERRTNILRYYSD